jgi:rare lipoprotein A
MSEADSHRIGFFVWRISLMQAHAFDSRGRLAAFALFFASAIVCLPLGGCAAARQPDAAASAPRVVAEAAPSATFVDASAADAPTLQTVSFETGHASFYARRFQGRRTASGEAYDMRALTAAHRTLPLGSYVRVTKLSDKRSVIVRINDRGPFVKGRLIDLSLAAAMMLGLQRAGSATVKLERVPSEVARKEMASIAQAAADAVPHDASAHRAATRHRKARAV